jgi:hypothetical protein
VITTAVVVFSNESEQESSDPGISITQIADEWLKLQDWMVGLVHCKALLAGGMRLGKTLVDLGIHGGLSVDTLLKAWLDSTRSRCRVRV